MDKPPKVPKSSITESGRNVNAVMDQNRVARYRAALSESDVRTKKLPKIEPAEQNMKQRWHELAVTSSEAEMRMTTPFRIYIVSATSGLRDDGYVLVGTKPARATLTPNGELLYVANSGSSDHNSVLFGELGGLLGSPVPCTGK